MLNLSKQQINALIDSLPDDILNECSKYICIPPVSLLNEIEHFLTLRFFKCHFKYKNQK